MARQAGSLCIAATLLVAFAAALGCDRIDWKARSAPSLPAAGAPRCADLLSAALAAERDGDAPDSEASHALLVSAHLERGRPDEALPHALAILRLAPDSADAHVRVGWVLLQQRDFAGAATHFDAALRLEPSSARAQIGAMWRRKLGGSLEEAARHAARAVALGGDHVAIWDSVGETWEALGEDERARAAYDQALVRFPFEPRLELRLAILDVRRRDDDGAAAHLARAGELWRDPQLARRLGVAFAARGRTAQAEAIFRALAARSPQGDARLLLAHLLRETGRAAEARALGEPGGPGLARAPLLEGLAPPTDLACSS